MSLLLVRDGYSYLLRAFLASSLGRGAMGMAGRAGRGAMGMAGSVGRGAMGMAGRAGRGAMGMGRGAMGMAGDCFFSWFGAASFYRLVAGKAAGFGAGAAGAVGKGEL